ncbi:DUF547 domain-containing protein [Francisella sp. Scap27]|uniref:DUF547 domain-containing protein n=1 Tax=Francisella sp. Scap27 TaxID=2589986 RepID=UPI0015BF120D|nr:DUF547 domain-containing protein [Francisella sp. Scap27]
MRKIKLARYCIACVLCLIFTSSLQAAPSANLWSYWDKSNLKSTNVINFNEWQIFLDTYVVKEKNQTYMRYAKVTDSDKVKLDKMIKNYASLNILDYNRDQQLAYWINMYNILTVETILKNYPVKSITDIDKNWFGVSKVWDQKVIKISGKYLTLNDIEHRIIRPIWKNPRVHAAVNCASISCPNLSKDAYQGSEINEQLNNAFSSWVNSSKGVEIKNNKLYLSEIFNWYGSDFGNQKQMRKFISYYIKNNKIKQALMGDNNIIYFKDYDWKLNQL